MKNIFLLFLLIFVSCQKDIEDIRTYSIEIYGQNTTCITSSTRLLRDNLTDLNLNYLFFDISEIKDNRVLDIVMKYSLGKISDIELVVNGVPQISKSICWSYPIVVIKINENSFGFENPNIEEIKKLFRIK